MADRQEPKARAFDFLFVVLLSAVFLSLFYGAVPSTRFTYDEADYMAAARMGVVENYIERSSSSVIEYAKTGYRAWRSGVSATELSEMARQTPDVSFYRHAHGPLYFHWLILARQLGGENECWQRSAGLLLHVLAFGCIYFGILLALGLGRLPAAVSGLLYLFSPFEIRTFLWLSTHVLFILVALLALFAMVRFMDEPNRNSLFVAVSLIAVAACTLEYSFVLTATMAGCMLVRVRPLLAHTARPARLAGSAILLFVGVCALLWPAGIFKLTILKPCLSIPYLALTRKGSFGSESLQLVWDRRFAQSPLACILLAACVVAGVFLLRRSDLRLRLAPFFVYAALLTAITLRSDSSRYASSGFAALYVLGGIEIGLLLQRIRPAAAAWTAVATACMLLALSARAVAGRPQPINAIDTASVLLDQNRREVRSLLVPARVAPAIQYYYPMVPLASYRPGESVEQVLVRLRVRRLNAALTYDLQDGEIMHALDVVPGVRRITGGTDPEEGRAALYLIPDERQ